MSFYPELLKIGEKLEKRGLKVLYPESSLIMKERNDFNVIHFRKGITNKDKARFIKSHFQKILKSQSILVVNNTKKGMRGYIGGNALMEMGIAFGSNIKIYLLRSVAKNHPFYEEIAAMNPTVIKGDFKKITLK